MVQGETAINNEEYTQNTGFVPFIILIVRVVHPNNFKAKRIKIYFTN